MNGSFYNPYMKNPDWGAGISGMASQIMQALLMKSMMGGRQQPPQTPMGMGQGMPQTGLQPVGGQSQIQKPQQGKPQQSKPLQISPELYQLMMMLYQSPPPGR